MSDIPVWVDWFGQLVDKIDEVGEAGLIERVKRVDWRRNDPGILRYGDENIDPFSFLSFLAHTFDTQYKEINKKNVSRVFGIENQDIFSDEGQSKFFPIPYQEVNVLFHDGETFYSDLLWRLFRQAHQGIEMIDAKDFSGALDIKYVAPTRLTRCFFFINPKDFFPITKATMPVIQKKIDKYKGYSLGKLKRQISKGEQGFDCYKSLLNKLQSDSRPKRPFYKIYGECING